MEAHLPDLLSVVVVELNQGHADHVRDSVARVLVAG